MQITGLNIKKRLELIFLPLFRIALILIGAIYVLFACSLDIMLGDEISDGIKGEINYGINHDVLQEYEGFLQIPGVGMQRFFEFNYPVTNYNFEYGSLYIRFNWKQLEPYEGEYNFELIDNLLQQCRERNMALAIRPVSLAGPGSSGGPVSVPQWLIDKGVTLLEGNYTGEDHPARYFTVDLDEQRVWEHHERLIRALGERYDGHPDLALVDIGSVGLWGEWHNYVNREFLPSIETCKKVIDLYFEAFPNTPLTIPANASNYVYDEEAWLVYDFFPYAGGKGNCGWRGDSWGNGPVDWNDDWNHHDNYYWQLHNKNPDSWKTGTVAFEPSYTLGSSPTPPKKVIDDAISWHATFVHNKFAIIPYEWMADMERLMKVIGFRMVLRDLSFDSFEILAGGELTVNMLWENIGIAPPYRDYRLAFRLRDTNNNVHHEDISLQSVRGWLPGEKSISVKYLIPKDMPSGLYSIEMGVVFHSSIEHNIPIANYGKTGDGWYNLGDITILD